MKRSGDRPPERFPSTVAKVCPNVLWSPKKVIGLTHRYGVLLEEVHSVIVVVLAQHLWNGPAVIFGVYSSLVAAPAAATRGVHDLQEQLIGSEDWEWVDDDEDMARLHWFAEADECIYTIEEFLVEPVSQPPLQA